MQFPTKDQSNLIKLHVMLPFVLHVFERDKKVIEASELKTKDPYLAMMNRIILQVEKDLAAYRKGLRANGIHIFEEVKSFDGIDLRYKFKGYEHRTGFVWHVIKSKVERLIGEYLEI
jgi:hypothetical protein